MESETIIQELHKLENILSKDAQQVYIQQGYQGIRQLTINWWMSQIQMKQNKNNFFNKGGGFDFKMHYFWSLPNFS